MQLPSSGDTRPGSSREAPQLEWVRPPLQARSQQTLERILDAAEQIINDKGVEAATVSEIAKRAGSSVGAFYARFADKEALVRCVLERFCQEAVATSEAVLQHDHWDGVSLRDALETMVAFTLRMMMERRGILVAVSVRAARDREVTALGDRLHDHITHAVHRLITARGHTMAHPDPETAVRIGVWMVLSSLEARALYATSDARKIADDVVAKEIAQMMIAYLGIDRRVDHGIRRLRKN